MDTTEKLVLITGQFAPEDAKDILTNVFSTKMQFHEMKNFSSQVRFGKDDDTAVKRIPELKGSLDKSLEMVAKAKSKNQQLVITAEIKIQLIDSPGENG